MSVLDILNKDTWIQGHMAHDKYDIPCEAGSERACKWCVLGAVWKTYSDDLKRCEITQRLQETIGGQVTLFNDTPDRTWEEVEAVIRKAGV